MSPSPQQEPPLQDERWKIAFAILERAQALPPADRRSFAESCTTDPLVLELVFELLEEDSEAPNPPPTTSTSRLGHRIGRYEITGELGQGGMGKVYSARDLELGRSVAIKFLSQEAIAERGSVDRLMREAQAASALNHPHIITVHEVVRSGDQAAIAMELVEGVSLRSCCGSPQPVAKVVHWGRQIASALAAAHDKGIVHRDIKPVNVMIRSDDNIKVLDFGIARQMRAGQDSSASHRRGGTIQYFSPEQAQGEPTTPRSDIFSLGLVLYELATGRHPFRSETPLQTLYAIVHKDPAHPGTLNPRLPASLSRLILGMLAKRPEKRPSADEASTRLAAIGDRPSGRSYRWLALAAVAASFVAVLAFLKKPAPAPSQIQWRQLTTTDSENRVTAAAISPDGKQLAYGDVRGEILLRSIQTNITKALRAPAALEIEKIAWFGDQSRLLLVGRAHAGEPAAAWAIRVDGSTPRLIRTEVETASASPDGSRIAFTPAGSREIWVMEPGREPKRLAEGGPGITFPVVEWSADGRHLICQRKQRKEGGSTAPETSVNLEPNFERFYETIDASTGAVTSSTPRIAMHSVTALPDGRVFFLWHTGTQFSQNVWEMHTEPATGKIIGKPHQVTSYSERALASISATSDGSKVAVVHYHYQPDVYVADLDASKHHLSSVRKVTLDLTQDYPHAFSPDGQVVYFESNRNGTFDIYRQRLGEPNAEFLAGYPDREDFNSILSPDGKWILYASSANVGTSAPDRRLERIPVSGGEPAIVPTGGPLDYFDCGLPTRGSRCVLRTTESREYVFYELDPVHGKGRELARAPWSPGTLGDWCLSADGTEVAIPNHDAKERIVRFVPLDSPHAQQRVIRLAGEGMIGGVRFSADGAGLFVALSREAEFFQASPLLRVNLVYADRSGAVTQLRQIPVATWPIVSPTGKQLAFPDGTIIGDAILLER